MKTTIENNTLKIEVENKTEAKQLEKFYNRGSSINKRIIFYSALWTEHQFSKCRIGIRNRSEEIVWQNVVQYFRSKVKKYLRI